jgi:2-C-methyl-D-erythritol 2,4-cyclodiphosphate synthase
LKRSEQSGRFFIYPPKLQRPRVSANVVFVFHYQIITLSNYQIMRIGFGIDFHQLTEGRDLWIGGVKIPHHKGALGHSDADVLLHAICDALLGALALGDIGMHFPNTDATYKDIDSKILLQKSYELIKARNYRVINVDSSICLEAPKIKKYSEQMRSVIAGILEVTREDVSVKATTTETMGFVGREEGLVAYATVLIQPIS